MVRRIAVISFVDPSFGLPDGGKQVVQRTCHLLSDRGYQVSFFAFHNKSEEKNHVLLGENTQHSGSFTCKSNLFLFVGRYPYCVERRYDRRLLRIDWNSFDAVLYEGEQVYRSFRNIHKLTRKNVVRMHDIESEYRAQLSKSQKGPISFLNGGEARKFLTVENELSLSGATFCFLSCDELKIFQQRFPACKEKCFYMPPFFSFHSDGQKQVSSGRYFLYFGDMTLPNNYASIKWYLENVFLPVQKNFPDMKIHICGKMSDKTKKEFASFGPSVFVKGFVEDLDQEIRNSRLVVCPILFGAGVKIKLLESLSYGKFVIANTKAVEGLLFENNKHLIVVKNKADFIEATAWYLDESNPVPSFSKELQEIFNEYYSPDAFMSVLEKVIYS